METLLKELKFTIRRAEELIKRTRRLDVLLLKGQPRECELGEVTRMKAQLQKTKAAMTVLDNPTPNGFDPLWISTINTVLSERGSDLRISDVSQDLWDAHIGPMLDEIDSGSFPDIDGGGTLRG